MGSRDIGCTRNCHDHADANTDAETNGIRTETNVSTLTFGVCVWGGGVDIKISNSFDVTERARVCGRNDNFQCSKGNNQKSMQPRVPFLRSARLLMVLNICVKFHENILNGFEVTERTRVCGKNCHFSMFKR